MKIDRSLKKYIKGIKKNKKIFEEMEISVKNACTEEEKCDLAKKAGGFASYWFSGHFASSVIENELLKISQNHTLGSLEADYEKHTFLHVMSLAYNYGGHTRVVERWIEQSPANEKHSLIFTGYDKQGELPEQLESSVKEKHGNIYKIAPDKSYIEKGLELRKIASSFEHIILHVHMDDVIPILAFGNKEFKRPVIFYNHADHRFWFGVSISDITAQIQDNLSEVRNKKRGITKAVLLGIPANKQTCTKLEISKTEARKKLNLPEDKKIILTYGNENKFKPFDNFDFLNFVIPVLKTDKNTICIGIGPNPQISPSWTEYQKQFKNQLIRKDSVQFEELLTYIIASDVILDSYPEGGGTGMIDAITYSRPLLSTCQLTDYLYKSDAYCKNKKILIKKLKALLSSEELRTRNIKSCQKAFNECGSYEIWQKNLKYLYDTCPQKHSIKNFEPQYILCNQDLFSFAQLRIKNKKKRIKINLLGIKISFKIKED